MMSLTATLNGDPQDGDVWDAAWENFTDSYWLEILESWMSFPPEANYFHVFIAFFIRFVVPDTVSMTRNGDYMRIHLDDRRIEYYVTWQIKHPKNATGEFWSGPAVDFIYKALQDGWRFTDAKGLMQNAPEPVKSQIGTCDNCKRDKARVQCGHNCKVAFYCGQQCANAHYDLHKLNCK